MNTGVSDCWPNYVVSVKQTHIIYWRDGKYPELMELPPSRQHIQYMMCTVDDRAIWVLGLHEASVFETEEKASEAFDRCCKSLHLDNGCYDLSTLKIEKIEFQFEHVRQLAVSVN